MKRAIFVTGTDTGIGKTLTSAFLISALRSEGVDVGYWKPIQTGTDDDTATLAWLSGIPVDELPRPAYSLALPAAPLRAGKKEGIEISLETVRQAWDRLPDRAWIVEGAGGLAVPIA